MSDITIIGSTNVDFIMKLDHLPRVGETVTDAQFMQTYGGKGANTAVAAARARTDQRVTFITALGNDLYAPLIVENFNHDGLDTSRILRAADVPTGSALVMFDRQGDNYLSVAPGSNYALLPAHVDAHADLIGRSALVVMQMEIRVETIRRVLEITQQHGIPVLFNFAPVRTRDLPVSAAMTGLVVNEVEASALTDIAVRSPADAARAAAALRQRGPRFVIVTLGKEGAVVHGADLAEHVPTFVVEPVDTTAAGDTFCGALAIALVEKRPLRDAVRFAHAASALSVTRMGAQPSIAWRTEIEAFMATAQLRPRT